MKLSQLSLADYNQLDSIPVINQDLSASGFTPVANTYYRHTGATTDTFTQGVIYLYDTAYHKLGESGGTKLNKYKWTLDLKQAVSKEDARRLYRILTSKCYVMGDISINGGFISMFLSNLDTVPSLVGTMVRNDNNAYNVTTVSVSAYAGSINATGTRFNSNSSADSLYRNNDNPSSSPFETLGIAYYNDSEIL